jgi:NADPH-dependent glutamate synthase beta subunit-like oxidoreductase
MDTLFNGNLEYDSKDELIKFINNVSDSDAIKIIEQSLNHANGKGSFNLLESYCVYQCIDKIKKTQNIK